MSPKYYKNKKLKKKKINVMNFMEIKPNFFNKNAFQFIEIKKQI